MIVCLEFRLEAAEIDMVLPKLVLLQCSGRWVSEAALRTVGNIVINSPSIVDLVAFCLVGLIVEVGLFLVHHFLVGVEKIFLFCLIKIFQLLADNANSNTRAFGV